MLARAIALTAIISSGATDWLRELWAQQGFDVTRSTSSASLRWPVDVTFERLLDEFVPAPTRDRFAVNIGGQDGKSHDPVYALYRDQHFSGVVFEAFPPPALFPNIASVNKSGRVHVAVGLVKTASVGSQLRGYGAPDAFDVLKIDIDSTDLPVLRAVLGAGFRPKLVMVEINHMIPPPLEWARLERADGAPQTGRVQEPQFFGVSANALFSELSAAGYALVAFELGSADGCATCEHNAWAVRADLLRARGFSPPDWRAMNRAYWKQTYLLNNRHGCTTATGSRRSRTAARSERDSAPCDWQPGWKLAQVKSAARVSCGLEGKLAGVHKYTTGWSALAEYSELLASPASQVNVTRQYAKRVAARLCGAGRGDTSGEAACALDAHMAVHREDAEARVARGEVRAGAREEAICSRLSSESPARRTGHPRTRPTAHVTAPYAW